MRTLKARPCVVDWPPALFVHTVEYPRLRACIHKEGRRIFRVGKPVSSLLVFLILQTNIMVNQSKEVVQELNSLFAGIDVGAEELVLTIRKNGKSHHPQKFTNTPTDRTRLVKEMVGMPGIIVCLEATGVYHFDLSIALHDAGVALMVVNPKSSHNFAKVLMKNSKTDAVDAEPQPVDSPEIMVRSPSWLRGERVMHRGLLGVQASRFGSTRMCFPMGRCCPSIGRTSGRTSFPARFCSSPPRTPYLPPFSDAGVLVVRGGAGLRSSRRGLDPRHDPDSATAPAARPRVAQRAGRRWLGDIGGRGDRDVRRPVRRLQLSRWNGGGRKCPRGFNPRPHWPCASPPGAPTSTTPSAVATAASRVGTPATQVGTPSTATATAAPTPTPLTRPRLSASIVGPTILRDDIPQSFDIIIQNLGDAPASNVVIDVRDPKRRTPTWAAKSSRWRAILAAWCSKRRTPRRSRRR